MPGPRRFLRPGRRPDRLHGGALLPRARGGVGEGGRLVAGGNEPLHAAGIRRAMPRCPTPKDPPERRPARTRARALAGLSGQAWAGGEAPGPRQRGLTALHRATHYYRTTINLYNPYELFWRGRCRGGRPRCTGRRRPGTRRRCWRWRGWDAAWMSRTRCESFFLSLCLCLPFSHSLFSLSPSLLHSRS